MNASRTYDIYLVPNGRVMDFSRGILGIGYPDECKCWGNDLTLEEVRSRYTEIADANFRRDGGDYDVIWNECATKNPDGIEEGFAEPEIACKDYLDRLTADANPLNWERIEWNSDLKWVTIREHIMTSEPGRPTMIVSRGDRDVFGDRAMVIASDIVGHTDTDINLYLVEMSDGHLEVAAEDNASNWVVGHADDDDVNSSHVSAIGADRLRDFADSEIYGRDQYLYDYIIDCISRA